MTAHHCLTMSPRSISSLVERDPLKEAECVESGSVAMRSETVQPSRMNPLYNSGILSNGTCYPFDKKVSGREGPEDQASVHLGHNKLFKIKLKRYKRHISRPFRHLFYYWAKVCLLGFFSNFDQKFFWKKALFQNLNSRLRYSLSKIGQKPRYLTLITFEPLDRFE